MQNWILMYITFLKPAKLFFKDIHTRIWKLWDAKHVTNEDTHFTDNLSIVCKHWTHTRAHYTVNKIGSKSGNFFFCLVAASLASFKVFLLWMKTIFFWWIYISCNSGIKVWNLPLLEQILFTVHVKVANVPLKDFFLMFKCKLKLILPFACSTLKYHQK